MTDEQAVREYFETSTWRLNQLQSCAVWDGSDVWARAEQAILNGLLRLNRLPRSDSYWATWANERSTFAKLSDYCAQLRNGDPGDIEAIWLAAAINLYACEDDFGSEAWRALHVRGEFSVTWAIDAAAVVEVYSGVPTVSELALLVRELGEEDVARCYLLDRTECLNVHTASWARRALEALNAGG